MIYAIVGSRNYEKLHLVIQLVNKLDQDSTVISGAALGPDKLAVQAAKQRGLKTKEVEANWARFGKAAGQVRNPELVKLADKIIAFWDGKSAGTQRTIQLARRAGKPLLIVHADGRLERHEPAKLAEQTSLWD
jgi:hypothetical protein